MAQKITIWTLVRWKDTSGVSGTGPIAIMAEVENGPCLLKWRTKTENVIPYISLEQATGIHCHNGESDFIEVTDEDSRKEAMREIFHAGIAGADIIHNVIDEINHTLPKTDWII